MRDGKLSEGGVGEKVWQVPAEDWDVLGNEKDLTMNKVVGVSQILVGSSVLTQRVGLSSARESGRWKTVSKIKSTFR